MVDMVKTAFDISFQYPGGRSLPTEADKALLNRIGCASSFSETIGIGITRSLRYGAYRQFP